MSETQSPIPDFDSRQFFFKISSNHKKILNIADGGCFQILHIKRTFGDTVSVYITNLYTIGIADYLDIRKTFPEINCIVTVSGWNYYTDDAKKAALKERIGLFTTSEFMGAMNVRRYWAYIRKDNKG